jgi:alkylated DNA repair dioxygenase AlkB
MLPLGLTYVPNSLSPDDQRILAHEIVNRPWDDTLKRLTQQYGYRYDYGKGPLEKCEEIPEAMMNVYKNVCKNSENEEIRALGAKELPNQLIINHYEPGEGIGAHTDDVNKFSDTILIFSLISPTVMRFSKESSESIDLQLLERSALLLKGEARYSWKHEIKQRKTDVINGVRVDRGRRISATFRWKN